MDLEGTRQRIRDTISSLKSKQIDYKGKSTELEQQRAELQSELVELRKESKKIQDEKDAAEVGLIESEAIEIIDELTQEISNLGQRQQIIRDTLQTKAGEAERLELEYAQLFVDAEYPKRLHGLKSKRDKTFQSVIDTVESLQNDFNELCELRQQSSELQNQKNDALAKLELPTSAAKMWGLTVDEDSNIIDIDWANDFSDFLRKLSDIEKKGLNLAV